jgi:hypothetical protein
MNKLQYQSKCIYCKKGLVAIGSSRNNGKLHKDWSTRQLHKKCMNGYELYLKYTNLQH